MQLILGLVLGGGKGMRSGVTVNRAIASNRNMLPSTNTTTANYVRHSLLKFKVPSNANFSAFQAYFTGWGQNAGGEFASPDSQNIKASIEYGGTVYPADFSGANNVDVAANGGAWGSFPGLTMPAGATGIIVTRAVGANTGSVNRIVGHGVLGFMNEGFIGSTNTGQDFTNGVYAKNAVANAPTVVGGNITACTVANGGVNYAVGTNVWAYELQANGTIGQKVIGYCNVAANAVVSISITSGTPPAGVAAWVTPTVTIGNQLSNTTQVYGPAVITGLPSVAAKSLIIHGTSIEIGFGSTDSIGDLSRNFGVYERGLNNRCGVLNLGSSSQVYQNYSNQTTYAKTYALIASLGNNVTHSLIGAPTNDVQAGATKVNTEIWVNSVRTAMVGNGHKVDFAMLLPRTTSSDAWATVVNQTEDTGFGAAGVGEGYNTDVTGGTLVSNGVGYIDSRTQFQDGTSTRKWDVSVAKTTDGIHPSLIGLGFATNNTTFKNMFIGYS